MHWSDQYIGQRYVAGQHDCAVFAARVQADQFGRAVVLPVDHGDTPFGSSSLIAKHLGEYLTPTQNPVDGDIVMALSAGRLWHIGVLAVIDGERWMVHASAQAGMVIGTRIADFGLVALKLEGYYQCKQ